MRAQGPSVIASAGSVGVALEPPMTELRVGDHLEITARVHLAAGARGPWMLAPTSDGPALQVVRGRLLSIDADSLETDPAGGSVATLRIPVIARAAGTTVLRARVTAYGCEAERCRPIAGEGALVIEVLAR
ncbi:MAG: hypothetical protein OHK0013_02710 [Sandaracinaceae bacterium]